VSPRLQTAMDLYYSGNHEELLKYCAQAEQTTPEIPEAPQLLHLAWSINHRAGNAVEAQRIQQIFYQRFGGHVLAADMHFAAAIKLMTLGDNTAAFKEFELIATQFPKAKVSAKAREIHLRLSDYSEPSTRNVSN
jgi:hypothetical protein